MKSVNLYVVLLRLKEFYFDAFIELSTCKDDSTFALHTEDWLMKILNFPNAKFIFVDNDNLVIFRRDLRYIMTKSVL